MKVKWCALCKKYTLHGTCDLSGMKRHKADEACEMFEELSDEEEEVEE